MLECLHCRVEGVVYAVQLLRNGGYQSIIITSRVGLEAYYVSLVTMVSAGLKTMQRKLRVLRVISREMVENPREAMRMVSACVALAFCVGVLYLIGGFSRVKKSNK